MVTKRSWNDLYTIKHVISSQIAHMKSFSIGVASVIIIFFLLSIFSEKLKKKVSTWIQEQTKSIQFMLPTTVIERILFLLVAITSGFCEETIFRGGLLYYLEHFPFQTPTIAMIVIAGLLFGIVHSYQGLKGIVATGYVGAILFYISIITGNLWMCIFLHFLIDVKFAFAPFYTVYNIGRVLSQTLTLLLLQLSVSPTIASNMFLGMGIRDKATKISLVHVTDIGFRVYTIFFVMALLLGMLMLRPQNLQRVNTDVKRQI